MLRKNVFILVLACSFMNCGRCEEHHKNAEHSFESRMDQCGWDNGSLADEKEIKSGCISISDDTEALIQRQEFLLEKLIEEKKKIEDCTRTRIRELLLRVLLGAFFLVQLLVGVGLVLIERYRAKTQKKDNEKQTLDKVKELDGGSNQVQTGNKEITATEDKQQPTTEQRNRQEEDGDNIESNNEEPLDAAGDDTVMDIEGLAQKFGILSKESRIRMLNLCSSKAKQQGNNHFDEDLEKAVEEFVRVHREGHQKKVALMLEEVRNWVSPEQLYAEVVNRVPEGMWMRFARLHLNLDEAEIQKFKRRHATFNEEQARRLAKTIRLGNINSLMAGSKRLIGSTTAQYVL